jgi:hypothetical protein
MDKKTKQFGFIHRFIPFYSFKRKEAKARLEGANKIIGM